MAGRIKKFLKSSFNVKAWIGAAFWINEGKQLRRIFQTLITIPVPQQPESFEEAVARLHLSEFDLMRRIKEFQQIVVIFCLMAMVLLGYLVYLCWIRAYTSVMMTTILLLIVLSLAFRYHFWLFQMRQRRLGCRLGEWWKYAVLGRKL